MRYEFQVYEKIISFCLFKYILSPKKITWICGVKLEHMHKSDNMTAMI